MNEQEKKWLNEINQKRLPNVPTLVWDERLANAARLSVANKWFQHEGHFRKTPAQFGFTVYEVGNNGQPRTLDAQVFYNISEGIGPSQSRELTELLDNFSTESLTKGYRLHWVDVVNPYWNRVGIAFTEDYMGVPGFIIVYGHE